MVYEIVPHSHRARGMTGERRRLLSGKKSSGQFMLDGIKMTRISRLCELCASVVNINSVIFNMVLQESTAMITKRYYNNCKKSSNERPACPIIAFRVSFRISTPG